MDAGYADADSRQQGDIDAISRAAVLSRWPNAPAAIAPVALNLDAKTDRWMKRADMLVARPGQAAAAALHDRGLSTGCGAEGQLAEPLVFTLP
jgi:hypothetical protein